MPAQHLQTDGKGPPLPLDSWLRIAIAATGAVAKLHQSGVIHQHIRPGTLQIDPRQESVELTGSGLSRTTAPWALKVPRAGLPYVAPEQARRAEGALDLRVDLYSLGMVLYELRAGTLPFHADDAPGWVECHVAQPPRPLAEASPATPAIVSEIIMRLLAKSPDERYQSAQGLAYDLQRCIEELSAHGHIAPFPLGLRDVWDKLRAVSRMYGRTQDLEALRGVVERVRETGRSELLLVTGPSGIGKSTLVRELQQRLGGAPVSFLWGKFEDKKSGIPYASVGQAFQDLIQRTIALPDAERAVIRDQLVATLGDDGQLIIDLIPQLALLIGKQRPVAPLPASDARYRFHLTFRNFLGVFATPTCPLVLFLDDLQWADFASLELLQHLVTHPDVRSLLVIGAYRDDEVDASHPLEATLSEVRGAEVPVTSIKLSPLRESHLVDLVVDTFRCDRDEASPLAALLLTKSGGYPFFAVQLLCTLHQQELIRFDERRWAWEWDIAEIEAQAITSDMVELMFGNLRRLPGDTLELLKLAACIGVEFSAGLLSKLCGKPPEEVRAALLPALADGLLVQRPPGYRFLHDRVLQAAYSLIPKPDRPGLHLRLGWLLLERRPVASREGTNQRFPRRAPQASSDAALDGIIFDVVNQFNLGVTKIEAADQRYQIAKLDLRAGRKAKVAGAARSAAAYLATGLSLLPQDSWNPEYALVYGMHLELAECEYLNGRFQEAERLCTLVVEHARTHVERAAGYRLQIQLATAQVDNARAVALGLSCLRLFGIELPENPSDEDVLREIGEVLNELRGRAIEELIDLPQMTDPAMVAAMEILSAFWPAAFYIASNLAIVVVGWMVRLSILHGNSPASVHGYVTLGASLCSRFGKFGEGYRFGKLAWDLGQRPGFGGYNAEASVNFGGTILIWSRHMRNSLEFFRVGFRISRNSGKLIYAASNVMMDVMTLLALGEPLDAVYDASVTALEFVTTAKYAFFADLVVVLQRVVRALQGKIERFGSLTGDGFDEEAFEAHLGARNIPLIRFDYYVYKLETRFWAHDYAEAHAAARAAEDLLSSGGNMIVEAEHCFYGALTTAALYGSREEAERLSLRRQLTACEWKLGRWAKSCPDNFSCRHALVAAEIARVDGRDRDAAALYEKAIRTSGDGKFVHIEGLACELAGRFYLTRPSVVSPAAHFRQARACYARWGAIGKVRHLEALHPDLFPGRHPSV
jgi:predicted ATPase